MINYILFNKVQQSLYIYLFFAFQPLQIIFKAYVVFQNRHHKSENFQILVEV